MPTLELVRTRFPDALRNVDALTLRQWFADPDRAPLEVRGLLRDRDVREAIEALAIDAERRARSRERVA